MVPEELKYTAEHEWVALGDDEAGHRVGITDFAQEALGDVVYVSLPEVGATVSAGQPVGEVESTKSVSEIYAPYDGEVTARNDSLEAQPELLNSDPYGQGWILSLRPADPDALGSLLDAAAYSKVVDPG